MMTSFPKKTALAATLALLGAGAFSGCSSSDYYNDGGSVDVHGSFYYGVGYSSGFYGNPWYGPGYYPPPVVVAPPPMHGGGGVGGGGGARPTPMPSMPTARRR